MIFAEALAQAVESFGDGFAVCGGEGLSASVDFNADERARLRDEIGEGGFAVGGGLSDGFIKQDDAGDIFLHGVLGLEEELAPIAAFFLSGGGVDGGESFGDGVIALIGGEDSLAGRRDLLCDFLKCLVHDVLPSGCSPVYYI